MSYTISVLLYLTATWIIWSQLHSHPVSEKQTSEKNTEIHSESRVNFWLIALIMLTCIVAHFMNLKENVMYDDAINLALGHAFSILSLTVVVLYLLVSFTKPIHHLGLVVLPLAVLALTVSNWIPGTSHLLLDLPFNMLIHLLIAMAAYAFLCLALAEALLLLIQDKQLRQSRPDRWLMPALPALQTMESNLFQLALVGFIWLSVNLVVGGITLLNSVGSLLVFNHHTVLSLMAWLGFATLLTGAYFRGWRGEIAARWIIGGFIVLGLAYFGTRFVVNVVLN